MSDRPERNIESLQPPVGSLNGGVLLEEGIRSGALVRDVDSSTISQFPRLAITDELVGDSRSSGFTDNVLSSSLGETARRIGEDQSHKAGKGGY